MKTNECTCHCDDGHTTCCPAEFVNKSDHDFTNIEAETSRLYDFGDGKTVKIERPVLLHVSSSGGHRIWDANQTCHYVPTGWIHLVWRAKPGEPHFVK